MVKWNHYLICSLLNSMQFECSATFRKQAIPNHQAKRLLTVLPSIWWIMVMVWWIVIMVWWIMIMVLLDSFPHGSSFSRIIESLYLHIH